MKITKDYLKQVIKESIQEIKMDAGTRNVGRELAAKAAGTAGLKAADPKRGVHTAMTGAEEYELKTSGESAGKNAMIRLKDADGDPISVLLDVTKIPQDLLLPANKEVPVFSVKTDKQIGTLMKAADGQVKFSEKTGKKYSTVMGSDEEDIEDDEV